MNLALPHATRLDGVADPPGQESWIFVRGRVEDVAGLTQQFSGPVPEEIVEPGIGEDEGPLSVGDAHRLGQVRQQDELERVHGYRWQAGDASDIVSEAFTSTQPGRPRSWEIELPFLRVSGKAGLGDHGARRRVPELIGG